MGNVLKIFEMSKAGEAPPVVVSSRQISEDPFEGIAAYGQTIKTPPYSMEQLILLAETSPVHSACLEQRAADLIADGVEFEPLEEDEGKKGSGSSEEVKLISVWWESLFPEMTSLEVMQAVSADYCTTGWGTIEVARIQGGRKNGAVGNLYHLPSHTLRAHADGNRFVQIRSGRQVWFKRWGYQHPEKKFLTVNGRWVDTDPGDKIASEVLLFRKPSRRSTWYGIPSYVAAIGEIALASAARDYNILFFQNSREPRHLIVLSGLEEQVDQVALEVAGALKTQHKEPHRNLILPLKGGTTVQIHNLATTQTDLQFDRLMDRTNANILLAHRMPPDRVGQPTRGLLGGSSVLLANRIYKDGVISRDQIVFEDRLTRFVEAEAPLATGVSKISVKAELEDLDISDENVESTIVDRLVRASLITLNEGRSRMGLSPHDEFEEMTLVEWEAKVKGGGGGEAPGGPGDEGVPGAEEDILGDPALMAELNDVATPEEIDALMTSKSRGSSFDWRLARHVMSRLDDVDSMLEEMLYEQRTGR